MSKKAAPIGQEVTFWEDKQDRPERRDAFSDNGDYSRVSLKQWAHASYLTDTPSGSQHGSAEW
jgi:hypothetical protein